MTTGGSIQQINTNNYAIYRNGVEVEWHGVPGYKDMGDGWHVAYNADPGLYYLIPRGKHVGQYFRCVTPIIGCVRIDDVRMIRIVTLHEGVHTVMKENYTVEDSRGNLLPWYRLREVRD